MTIIADATPRFTLCLPHTLAQECPCPGDWANLKNFSDDAHDPGGKTMCGIIQREYDAWRKRRGEPVRDVRRLEQAEGEEIYLTSYWNPECPKLPVGLDMQFFDEAVNTGAGEATKVLQHVLNSALSLNLAVDGEWGAASENALAEFMTCAAQDPAILPGIVETFTERRHDVYKMMLGDKYFDHAWMTRTAEIGAAALAMAKAVGGAP